MKLIATMSIKDGSIFVSSRPLESDLSTRYSISCGKNPKLAARLMAAINAGVAFPNAKVATDVHGVKYITHDCRVSGYRMNADLLRLGF